MSNTDSSSPGPLAELLKELEQRIPTECRAGDSGGAVILHIVGLEQIERWKLTIRAALAASVAEARTATDLQRALTLATAATNGWACFATRGKEHDEIARLHREIKAMWARTATTPETGCKHEWREGGYCAFCGVSIRSRDDDELVTGAPSPDGKAHP